MIPYFVSFRDCLSVSQLGVAADPIITFSRSPSRLHFPDCIKFEVLAVPICIELSIFLYSRPRMEFDFVKEQLGLSFLKPMRGAAGGGCICQGHGFSCDRGEVYLKWCDGESEVRQTAGCCVYINTLQK